MTERKPPHVSVESWVEKQIRESMDRGEFDNLPGAGKPLDLDKSDDELWWIRKKMHREGVSADAALPTPLRLRKEIEDLPATVRPFVTERAVREVVEDLNKRITDWLRVPVGPPVIVVPVDVEDVVAQWKADRPAPPVETAAPERKSSWLDRLFGQSPR
jgi:Domain of unknown function (DUF1992)